MFWYHNFLSFHIQWSYEIILDTDNMILKLDIPSRNIAHIYFGTFTVNFKSVKKCLTAKTFSPFNLRS
jgi:hypothetical protein